MTQDREHIENATVTVPDSLLNFFSFLSKQSSLIRKILKMMYVEKKSRLMSTYLEYQINDVSFSRSPIHHFSTPNLTICSIPFSSTMYCRMAPFTTKAKFLHPSPSCNKYCFLRNLKGMRASLISAFSCSDRRPGEYSIPSQKWIAFQNTFFR